MPTVRAYFKVSSIKHGRMASASL